MSKKRSALGTWKCKDCGEVFETKSKLFEHRHSNHIIVPRNYEHICPYCGQELGEGNKRKLWSEHKGSCQEFLKNHTIKGQRLWNEEERQHLSKKRKEFLEKHPDEHPWKNNDKFKSQPCEDLKKYLRDRGYSFEEEVCVVPNRNYSVDICFKNLMLILEINGNQHYDLKNECLLPYYQKRHDEIESLGWKVLEIPYNQSYSEEFREGLCRQLDAKLSSKQLLCGFESRQPYILTLKEINERKLKKKEEKLKKREILLKECPTDSLGRILTKVPNLAEWELRKEKILTCGVDLTTFGWVGKVTEATGLSKRIIENTIKKFPNDFEGKFFRRKLFNRE